MFFDGLLEHAQAGEEEFTEGKRVMQVVDSMGKITSILFF